jgi:hypothetical protein
MLGRILHKLSTVCGLIEPNQTLVDTSPASHNGKVTCNYHLQRSLTSINIEYMDNAMNLLHEAFMQSGGKTDNLIKK